MISVLVGGVLCGVWFGDCCGLLYLNGVGLASGFVWQFLDCFQVC